VDKERTSRLFHGTEATPDRERVPPEADAACLNTDGTTKGSYGIEASIYTYQTASGEIKRGTFLPNEIISKTAEGSAEKTVESMLSEVGDDTAALARFDSVSTDGCSTAISAANKQLAQFQHYRQVFIEKEGLQALNTVCK
jgi:hypothetical protein